MPYFATISKRNTLLWADKVCRLLREKFGSLHSRRNLYDPRDCWNAAQYGNRSPAEKHSTYENDRRFRKGGQGYGQQCVLQPTDEGVVNEIDTVRVIRKAV